MAYIQEKEQDPGKKEEEGKIRLKGAVWGDLAKIQRECHLLPGILNDMASLVSAG